MSTLFNSQVRRVLWLLTFITVFQVSCKKIEENAPIDYVQMYERFFDASKASVEIQAIAEDLKKQEAKFNFLPDFVRKNGYPRWDKVFYNDTKNSNNIARSFSSSVDDKGFYLIPLQFEIGQPVTGYICSYKHNSTLYTYRSYNKDSLNSITPYTHEEKNSLLNTLVIIGYFEKEMNNKNELEVFKPIHATVKNPSITIHVVDHFQYSSLDNEEPDELDLIIEGNYQWQPFGWGSSWTTIAIAVGVTVTSMPEWNPTGNPWIFGTGWPYTNTPPEWNWWWTDDPENGNGGGGTGTFVDPENPPYDFVFQIPQGDPITLQQYFHCFDFVPDAGATYSITIAADLPVNSNPEALFNSSFTTGHSFLTMTKSNGTVTVSQTFGFYPNSASNILGIDVGSHIESNSEREENAWLTTDNITTSQFQALRNQALLLASTKNYNLGDYNCTDYALEVFNYIRPGNPLIVPDDVNALVNFGTTPNNLYLTLLNTTGAGTDNGTGTRAPASAGACP